MTNEDERLRLLEQDHSALVERVRAIQVSQAELWVELDKARRDQRDQYEKLRADMKEDSAALMTAINANKLAWSMMNTGTKVAAWIILALASVGGAVSGVALALKKFFA